MMTTNTSVVVVVGDVHPTMTIATRVVVAEEVVHLTMTMMKVVDGLEIHKAIQKLHVVAGKAAVVDDQDHPGQKMTIMKTLAEEEVLRAPAMMMMIQVADGLETQEVIPWLPEGAGGIDKLNIHSSKHYVNVQIVRSAIADLTYIVSGVYTF